MQKWANTTPSGMIDDSDSDLPSPHEREKRIPSD